MVVERGPRSGKPNLPPPAHAEVAQAPDRLVLHFGNGLYPMHLTIVMVALGPGECSDTDQGR